MLGVNEFLATPALPLEDCSFESWRGNRASDPELSSDASWRRVRVLAAEAGREAGREFGREFGAKGPKERECWRDVDSGEDDAVTNRGSAVSAAPAAFFASRRARSSAKAASLIMAARVGS